MLRGVNWIAVVVAVVLMQALGFLWYGPLLGEAWLAAMPAPPADDNMTTTMVLGVLNTVIVAVGLAWLFARLGVTGLMPALATAFLVWLFFSFTTMAIDYLYLGHNARLVAINMGYQLVSYLVAGAVLGLMRRRAAAAAPAAA
jgi:hypothetical protein